MHFYHLLGAIIGPLRHPRPIGRHLARRLSGCATRLAPASYPWLAEKLILIALSAAQQCRGPYDRTEDLRLRRCFLMSVLEGCSETSRMVVAVVDAMPYPPYRLGKEGREHHNI